MTMRQAVWAVHCKANAKTGDLRACPPSGSPAAPLARRNSVVFYPALWSRISLFEFAGSLVAQARLQASSNLRGVDQKGNTDMAGADRLANFSE